METPPNRPVRVQFNGDTEVIADAAQAVEFLQRWPEERRGHVYLSAWNACTAAVQGRISQLDAMRTFIGFADVVKIYVPSEEPIVEMKGRKPLNKRDWQ